MQTQLAQKLMSAWSWSAFARPAEQLGLLQSHVPPLLGLTAPPGLWAACGLPPRDWAAACWRAWRCAPLGRRALALAPPPAAVLASSCRISSTPPLAGCLRERRARPAARWPRSARPSAARSSVQSSIQEQRKR